METETIDLQAADSAQFRQLLDDMQYSFFKRARAARPDAPLSRFFPICRDEQQAVQFENRYRREAK